MKKQINIRLDQEIIDEIKKISQDEKKSFTQTVTDVLWSHIKSIRGEK